MFADIYTVFSVRALWMQPTCPCKALWKKYRTDRSIPQRERYVLVCEVRYIWFYSVSLQWVITDARHDSTANAYHTTVPCLSGRYNYIIFTIHFVHYFKFLHVNYTQHSEDRWTFHPFSQPPSSASDARSGVHQGSAPSRPGSRYSVCYNVYSLQLAFH